MSTILSENTLSLENSYLALPDTFYTRIEPRPVSNPQLLRLNRPLAEQLGLDTDWLESPEGVAVLAGNQAPEAATPIALAYAGHQFGQFVPSLGDGRAVLLGELVDRSGVRRDIQLKGSGRTPYSRGGDGRASLGPVIREYLVSEGMAALGIRTTRALAMVTTGDTVVRMQPEPGGVLTRVAASHIRVGTFEYAARRGSQADVQALADYVIARHYPHLTEAEQPYRDLIEAIALNTADLVADWLLVGFIHGVMNTDNLAVSGETLDYGPCAFMDSYHPETVYSSIDQFGRYAYDQQPRIAFWNLARLAETLLPLLADDEQTAIDQAQAALDSFGDRFEQSYNAGLRRKIGLQEDREGDNDLAKDLLQCMADQHADFTLTFRRLGELQLDDTSTNQRVRELFADGEAFDAWAVKWRERLRHEHSDDNERAAMMNSVNPAYIPRNHRVEHAIHAAMHDGDMKPVEELLTVLTDPYRDHPGHEHLAAPPRPEEVVRQTFCGT